MILEHMVSAMNTFIKVISPDSRTQICKLGEEIFPNILYLWHNVASEALKVCFFYFILFTFLYFNPIAFRKAKIVCNFGLSECNRVKKIMLYNNNIISKEVLSAGRDFW